MYSVYLRRAEEAGKVIFPGKFCSTNEEAKKAKKLGTARKSLESLKHEKGPYEYGCQYLNDPVDDSSIEFKREWFRRYEHDEETVALLKASQCVISVDPAFKLSETHDQTGIIVARMTEKGIYVQEALGLKINADQLIDKIFELVETYDPFKVKIETVAAQMLLIDILRKEMMKRGRSFMLDEYHPGTTQTKAMRIRKLIPYYANGQIIHRRGLVDLEEQLVQFPRGKRDDIIDALAAQTDEWHPGAAAAKTGTKEYTWKWWQKQTRRPSNTIQGLFNDLNRRPY